MKRVHKIFIVLSAIIFIQLMSFPIATIFGINIFKIINSKIGFDIIFGGISFAALAGSFILGIRIIIKSEYKFGAFLQPFLLFFAIIVISIIYKIDFRIRQFIIPIIELIVYLIILIKVLRNKKNIV